MSPLSGTPPTRSPDRAVAGDRASPAIVPSAGRFSRLRRIFRRPGNASSSSSRETRGRLGQAQTAAREIEAERGIYGNFIQNSLSLLDLIKDHRLIGYHPISYYDQRNDFHVRLSDAHIGLEGSDVVSQYDVAMAALTEPAIRRALSHHPELRDALSSAQGLFGWALDQAGFDSDQRNTLWKAAQTANAAAETPGTPESVSRSQPVASTVGDLVAQASRTMFTDNDRDTRRQAEATSDALRRLGVITSDLTEDQHKLASAALDGTDRPSNRRRFHGDSIFKWALGKAGIDSVRAKELSDKTDLKSAESG